MKIKLLAFTLFFASLAFTSCKKDNTATATTPQAMTVVPLSAVPAAIVAGFNNNFANATEVEWQRNNDHFEVEFNHQGQRHHSSFDNNGQQNSHSISCASAAVPANVLSAFRARYPNDMVYEWNQKSDGTWKAHFLRGTIKWEALFSATGVFIKEEHE